MNVQNSPANRRPVAFATSGKDITDTPTNATLHPARVRFFYALRLTQMIALVLSLFTYFISGQRVSAQAITNYYEFSGLNLAIPDYEGLNLSGVQDTREISMDYSSIEGISVTVNISGTESGAVNGDFYAYLTKGDHIAILLNRPGRTLQNPVGYGDNGLHVRFEDTALSGDIHQYRLTLSGSHLTPLDLGSHLTGTWAPDGRHRPPDLTLDTDPRTHTLSVFNGTDPSGEWTLFIADLDFGGSGVLTSWSLEIAAIPEPSSTVLLLLGSMLVFFTCRYKRNTD